MSGLQAVKKIAGKVTDRSHPSGQNLTELVWQPNADTFCFKDDGIIPNHPHWPLIVYRNAVRLPQGIDPAAVFEQLFESNGWGKAWHDGIYHYVHYHSGIHEVLGIARGHARVQFGGAQGRGLELKSGDVAILPAGTGHQCVVASSDLLVVGAYPASGMYDECTRSEEHAEALKAIRNVARPRKDPVYGPGGPLLELWSSQ